MSAAAFWYARVHFNGVEARGGQNVVPVAGMHLADATALVVRRQARELLAAVLHLAGGHRVTTWRRRPRVWHRIC